MIRKRCDTVRCRIIDASILVAVNFVFAKKIGTKEFAVTGLLVGGDQFLDARDAIGIEMTATPMTPDQILFKLLEQKKADKQRQKLRKQTVA